MFRLFGLKGLRWFKECTMQDGGEEKKMLWAADEECFNALCKEGGGLLGNCRSASP